MNEERKSVVRLDTRAQPHVRIVNAAFDESDLPGKVLVIRGRVDPATLRFLKVDMEYQRPLQDRADVFQALKAGEVVPDIDVGVRGEDFTTVGADVVIRSPAYIIDGSQRVGTALKVLDVQPNADIRIGALVHFNTDRDWEAARFTELNRNTVRVSPNLHLRNLRTNNDGLITLYGLCHNDPEFPLRDRVCWSQSMRRGDLLTALTMGKAVRRLHGHLTANTGMSVTDVAASLARAAAAIGMSTVRTNTATFFSFVDEAWGLRAVEYRRAAPQLKGTFLNTLARVFSRHEDFWDGPVLRIEPALRRKIASFSLADPYVASLCQSSGPAGDILERLIIDHINSGKRTRRLRSRYER